MKKKEKAAAASSAPASEKSSGGLGNILILVMVIALIFALLAASTPTAKKKNVIATVGGEMISELQLVPSLVSYYDGTLLDTLAQNPADSYSYQYVSEVMATLRAAGGFDSVTLLVSSGNQFLCAADGAAGSGESAYSPASLLSLDSAVKTLASRIVSGKSDGGIVSNLITGRTGESVVCTLLPVYGQSGELAGILSAETSVGDARYHLVGGINLYIVALVFAAIAAACAIVLYLMGRFGKKPTPPAPSAPVSGDAPAAATPDAASSAPADDPPAKPAPAPAQEAFADDIMDADVPTPSLTLPDEDETTDDHTGE
jgi:uncharacterized membrane protein YeaQ/YmgE (transglycosylase-associated protein family)